MKFKSYIFQIALAAVGAGTLGACEDMLDHDSTYVLYDSGHLTNPSDTATSLVGILYKMQAIGDRTNLLGEVRGDLVSLVTERATTDLQQLANFEVDDNNKYNQPRDYYAVINNCNYFLAYADTTVYDSRGDQIFAKEMVQVRAIRAWTYLQLALIYGKVPFYTEPLLTEQDAERVTETKDLRGICDYFINELTPYSLTDWPSYHVVGSIMLSNCYIPVYMLLGDLYLWRASLQGQPNGEQDYRNAARCYFRWIMDTRYIGGSGGRRKPAYYVHDNRNDNVVASYGSTSRYAKWNQEGIINGQPLYGTTARIASQISGSYGGEFFSMIPMDSASSQGYFSELRGLYNSTIDNNSGAYVTSTNYSITPSQRMLQISQAQSYYYLNPNTGQPQEIVADIMDDDPQYIGDLRLAHEWYTTSRNINQGGVSSTFSIQTISKNNNRNVNVYRKTDAWLRLAEALNNGGFPRMAYAILATGLGQTVITDSVMPYCNDADKAFINELNSSENHFADLRTRNGIRNNDYNMIGLHSLGSGFAELNPDYAYPMVDSLDAEGNAINGYTGQDSLQWAYDNMTAEQAAVDSMIITEMALETSFEGKRFYDLVRWAMRYSKPEWVADNVSKRNDESSSLRGKLLDPRNWYLKYGDRMGMQ